MESTLAFGDCETTGLDQFRHEAWEVAFILCRDGKQEERVWHIQPRWLPEADPKALEINRYEERTSAPGWAWDNPYRAAREIWTCLDGAVILGSNPSFDTGMLTSLIEHYAQRRPTWHYRPIDVPTMAAGWLHAKYGASGGQSMEDGELEAVTHPFSSYRLSQALGVEPPEGDDAHTALGDARWIKALYDSITLVDHRDPDTYHLAASNAAERALVGGRP